MWYLFPCGLKRFVFKAFKEEEYFPQMHKQNLLLFKTDYFNWVKTKKINKGLTMKVQIGDF
jgi:hypothetical protein